jgi:hypothetical protein
MKTKDWHVNLQGARSLLIVFLMWTGLLRKKQSTSQQCHPDVDQWQVHYIHDVVRMRTGDLSSSANKSYKLIHTQPAAMPV